MKIERGGPVPHQFVGLRQTMEYPAFQFRHLGCRQTFAFLETVQITQDKAQRIPQASIGIGLVLDNFRADLEVFGIVGRDHPDTQNVCAVLFDDFLWRNDIACRFRHLLLVVGQNETMGQHRIIRCPTTGAAGFEQARMKPPAMLV